RSGGKLSLAAHDTRIVLKALAHLAYRQAASRMIRDSRQRSVEHLSRNRLLRMQLVEHPEDTVIVDRLAGGELAQRAVAGEQRPVVDLGERQREAVGERQGR